MLARARADRVVVFDVPEVFEMHAITASHRNGRLVTELEVRPQARLIDDEGKAELRHVIEERASDLGPLQLQQRFRT